MTVLKVPDMHCQHCVARITAALEETGVKFTVSLDDRTVTIDGCEKCVKTAIEALDDIGFEAEA